MQIHLIQTSRCKLRHAEDGRLDAHPGGSKIEGLGPLPCLPIIRRKVLDFQSHCISLPVDGESAGGIVFELWNAFPFVANWLIVARAMDFGTLLVKLDALGHHGIVGENLRLQGNGLGRKARGSATGKLCCRLFFGWL